MEDKDSEENGRLFIVANRLPISIKQQEDGSYEFNASPGGLASSLAGLASHIDFVWFGWPGIDVHRSDKDSLREQLKTQRNAVPVFLSHSMAQKHYNGFSNSQLWPLLHGMPEKANTDSSWSEAYNEVNEIFADNLIPQLEDDDVVWIHDYHLLLLPGILRARLRKKKVKIGFYLHTPFPSEDFFSILPFREAICNGLLSCDVVGFHVPKYVTDFLDSAEKVLEGVERSPHDLHYKDRKVIVHHFPIGIDPNLFHSQLESQAVQDHVSFLSDAFKDKTIIISIDRLDYTKGIPQKLLAYDRFLTDHPEWIEKVVLIQVAVPTRSEVDEYRKLQAHVEQLVGFVNGKHSTFTHNPLIYRHCSIPFPELTALYSVADMCIVSSVRDGLNLVSYEYIACQALKKNPPTGIQHAQKGPGILVLSQYTGAATMLPSSLLFNPWDTPRFAETIHHGLEIDVAERTQRYDEAAKVVEYWTSLHWGRSFCRTLQTMKVDEDEEPAGEKGS